MEPVGDAAAGAGLATGGLAGEQADAAHVEQVPEAGLGLAGADGGEQLGAGGGRLVQCQATYRGRLNIAEIGPSALYSNASPGAIRTYGHKIEAWLAHRDQRQTEISGQFGTSDSRINRKSAYPTAQLLVRPEIARPAILAAAVRRVLEAQERRPPCRRPRSGKESRLPIQEFADAAGPQRRSALPRRDAAEGPRHP